MRMREVRTYRHRTHHPHSHARRGGASTCVGGAPVINGVFSTRYSVFRCVLFPLVTTETEYTLAPLTLDTKHLQPCA